jgi:hypothetical protein
MDVTDKLTGIESPDGPRMDLTIAMRSVVLGLIIFKLCVGTVLLE